MSHEQELGPVDLQENLSEATDARLVELLSTPSGGEARGILSDRLFRYSREGNGDDMDNVVSGLVAVLEDASLDEESHWHALCLLRTPLRFESTADVAFQAVCRTVLHDPFGYVRLTAVEMLGDLGRAEAIPVLKQAVLDEKNIPLVGHYSVQETAVGALGGCGPDAATVLLELRSNDELEAHNRIQCISALARTGNEHVALPELLKIIKTGTPTEVSSAVAGLGGGFHKYSSDSQATIMDVIRAALSHPTRPVREAACAAVERIGDPALIPLLEPLLQDPHKELTEELDETMTKYVTVEIYPVRKRAEMAIKELRRIAEHRAKSLAPWPPPNP